MGGMSTSGGLRPQSRTGLALVALSLATALAVGACKPSGYDYVGSQRDDVFMRVPSSWKGYDTTQMLTALHIDQTASAGVFHWLVGFDASPDPSVDHVLLSGGVLPHHPVVLTYVRTLNPAVRDGFSIGSIRNARFSVDQAVSKGQGELVSSSDVLFKGGFHGEHDVFTLGGSVSPTESLQVNQVGVVDPAVSKLYLLVVTCDARCYRQNQTVIDDIVKSWQVKEP